MHKDELKELIVDKTGYTITEKGSIKYNDEQHVYYTSDSYEKAFGVTTLLHDYGEKFNSDFFSKYKAIERIRGGAKLFKQNDSRIRSDLLNCKKITSGYLKALNISEDQLKLTTQEILDEWDAKNKKATDDGTAFHLMKEEQAYDRNAKLFEALGIDDTFEVIDGVTGVDILNYENALFPEYLISFLSKKNGYPEVFVCGQVDVLVKKGNELWVLDYKTNEKLDFTAYRSKKMNAPCSAYQDCNYGHYSLQLSMYSYFLEQAFGLSVTKTELIHIERDDIDVKRTKKRKLETKRYNETSDIFSGEVVHYKVNYDKNVAKNIILDMHRKLKKKTDKEFNLDNLYPNS